MVGGALSGMLAYANLPSSWILPQERATASYLSKAKLQNIPIGVPVIPGAGQLTDPSSLWRDSGAVFMAVRRPG